MERRWSQQPYFKELVLLKRRELGLSPEEMAARMGITAGYLHNLLYDIRAKPSLDAIEGIAKVLGVDAGKLVDNEGAAIEGLEDMGFTLSPTKATALRLLAQSMKDPNITDQQGMLLVDVLKSCLAMLKLK